MHRTHAGHGSIWPAKAAGARGSDQSTLTPERIAELRALLAKAEDAATRMAQNKSSLTDLITFRSIVNAFLALIDAAERAPVAGWRPIETAPVDLPVLLYCPNLGVANPERIELGPAHTSRGSHHSWATMWMPLPAAPVDGGEG